MTIVEARLYIQQGEPATRSALTGGFTEKVPPCLHYSRAMPTSAAT